MKHFLHEEMDTDGGAGEQLPSAKSCNLIDLRRSEEVARRAMTANVVAAVILVLTFVMEFTKMVFVLKAVASVIEGINRLTYTSSDASPGDG